LGSAQQELATFENRLSTVQADLDRSNEQLAQAKQDRQDAEQQLSDARGALFEVAMNLDQARIELDEVNEKTATLERRISELEERKTQLDRDIQSEQFRVDNLVALKDQLGGEIEQLEARLASFEEGEIVIDRGTQLVRVVIPPDGDPASLLEAEMARLAAELEARGMSLAEESYNAWQPLVEDAASLDAENGSVLVASAARNVVEGGEVLLSFDARSLKPLFNAGDVMMQIIIYEDSARARMPGVALWDIQVPEHFDDESLEAFFTAVDNAFLDAALRLGVLPDMDSGALASPTGQLEQYRDTLITLQRPVAVRFTCRELVNVAAGFGSASVNVTPHEHEGGSE
jgi:hypothetical protein